jgi:hypothetical protein
MKRYSCLAVLVIGLAFVTETAHAQKKPFTGKRVTLDSAIMDNWKFISKSFIDAADAMPEDKFNFAPPGDGFKGVRTFAEQVILAACANYAFFREIENLTPPADCEKGGGPDPSRTKAEILKYVRESFAYSDTVIAKINAQNMLVTVEGRYAGPNTYIGMIMTAIWHATDHYGQMIEYLRMNGIVPPASR